MLSETKVEGMHSKAKAAVEAICEDALDNDQTSVEYTEIEAVAEEVGLHVTTLIGMVKALGLRVGPREKVKEVRGFTANSHDRWHGKGSCPTHGGSGWEQIIGFAGKPG